MTTARVTTGCRLHFGLLAFGRAAGRQYGGLGAMIDSPRVVVQARPQARLEVFGPHADRARRVAERWMADSDAPLAGARVDVLAAPELHQGLGVGTQLELAVAAALELLATGRAPPAVELAARLKRAARSAVGTHGFQHGGLIYDAGKLPGEAVGGLAKRVALPDAWRFVLLLSPALRGRCGDDEARVFAGAAAVPEATEEALRRELEANLLPAARREDFETFSAALHRYNHRAGLCYEAWQGGAYAHPRLAALVERLRSAGVLGVGQSSWGPTLFALAEGPPAAERLAARLREEVGAELKVEIAAPRNAGARCERFDGDEEPGAEKPGDGNPGAGAVGRRT